MLLNPAEEDRAVDSAVDHQRRYPAATANTGQERSRFPMAEGNRLNQTRPDKGTASKTSQVCFGPCFVKKDEAVGMKMALPLFPARTLLCDVRTCTFGCDENFFYMSISASEGQCITSLLLAPYPKLF